MGTGQRGRAERTARRADDFGAPGPVSLPPTAASGGALDRRLFKGEAPSLQGRYIRYSAGQSHVLCSGSVARSGQKRQ
ncbi:hypothetical protein GCM10010433_16380 [Streptomyces pulveraceus]